MINGLILRGRSKREIISETRIKRSNLTGENIKRMNPQALPYTFPSSYQKRI